VQEPITAQFKPITVAIDAMGGDLAPQAVITGALDAARGLPDIQVVLVGDEAIVRPLMAQGNPPANLTIRHASQVIDMCDAPSAAIRQKRDSSIAVGMRMVRDGEAHAFVSAGNSGAMMAAATLVLKLQPGIDRPAIAAPFPTKTGYLVMLDAGATMDCKPSNLLQFAHLGNAYARAVMERPLPRIGLLSVGEEPTKGDELTKDTHALLKTSGLNFVGNVEPKEMARGEVDVVVCDGFVGNLMLKAGEAYGSMPMELIKTTLSQTLLRRLAAALLRPAFREVKKQFDYSQYGGALLLGVNGIVVIGHGRSTHFAIENAIRLGARAAAHGLVAPVTSNGAPTDSRGAES